jgi:hypothetical protein
MAFRKRGELKQQMDRVASATELSGESERGLCQLQSCDRGHVSAADGGCGRWKGLVGQDGAWRRACGGGVVEEEQA